tara:strand:- start:383 stop:610 length:228 start_codon:yes stop_codon:yes gene_type:complete
MKVVIYGKEYCPFCVKARQVCEQRGFDYKYYKVGKDFHADWLRKKFTNAKTYPQIVIDNTHVGGYTDMMEFLDGE